MFTNRTLRTNNLVRRDAGPLATLAAMVAWFCHEMIFSGQIPFFRDLPTYFYPIKFSVAESLRSLELPLWEYRMAAGFPLIAGLQSAVFYPVSLVFTVLPFPEAIRFGFVFHYAVAASGAHFLFRGWRAPAHVAVLGAVFFAFAGTVVSFSNLLNHFQSAVWLPWLLYSWERSLRASGGRPVAIFVLTALCQILAGSPEIFLLSVPLLALDTLRLAREENVNVGRRIATRSIVACVLIIGVGMIQWLPTAELVMESRRDHAIHMSEALSWSLQPTSLIGLFIPTLEPDDSLTVGIRLLFAPTVPFLLSHYIGIVGLFGVCGWFCTAPTKERFVVVAALAGSLVLALGSFTSVYPSLYEWLPPLRILRFPEKYWYLCFSLLVFMIVRGIQRLEQQNRLGAAWKTAAMILVAFIVPYLCFRLRPQFLADLLALFSSEAAASDARTIATILVVLEKQIVLSLVLLFLFLLYCFDLLQRNLLQTMLVLAAFFDLISVTQPLHFLRDQQVLRQIPRILEKASTDHGRLFYYPPGENLHPSLMKVAGNPSYRKATEIPLNNLLPNAGILFGFEYFQDIDALSRRSYTDFLMFINALPEERRGKLLRILNVKYVVAFHALKVEELKLIREFPEHYSVLYGVNNPVPRVYIVGHTFHHADARSTLERMASDEFDPLRDVVLDGPVSLQTRSFPVGKAMIRSYEHRRVVIDAQLSAPGILVLADAFYPGWKVLIDGQEERIRRANLLFRGVELSSGTHVVEFVYDPLSFKIGLFVSLVTAMGLIAIMIVSSTRRCNSSGQ